MLPDDHFGKYFRIWVLHRLPFASFVGGLFRVSVDWILLLLLLLLTDWPTWRILQHTIRSGPPPLALRRRRRVSTHLLRPPILVPTATTQRWQRFAQQQQYVEETKKSWSGVFCLSWSTTCTKHFGSSSSFVVRAHRDIKIESHQNNICDHWLCIYWIEKCRWRIVITLGLQFKIVNLSATRELSLEVVDLIVTLCSQFSIVLRCFSIGAEKSSICRHRVEDDDHVETIV